MKLVIYILLFVSHFFYGTENPYVKKNATVATSSNQFEKPFIEVAQRQTKIYLLDVFNLDLEEESQNCEKSQNSKKDNFKLSFFYPLPKNVLSIFKTLNFDCCSKQFDLKLPNHGKKTPIFLSNGVLII
jgi:hypothetical protein